MAAKKDKEEMELWIGFARDAMSRYEIPEFGDLQELEEAVDEMIEFVTQYADGMLDEISDRYSTGSGKPRRRKKPRAEEEEEEEEETE
jgi:hypothetical protein